MRQSQSPARSPNTTGYVNRSAKPLYRSNSTNKSESLFNRIGLFVFTGVLFGIGLLYLIVGIIYLSIYYYPYSFSQFSTTLVAGLFIAWSGLLFFIVAANIFLIWSKRQQVILFTAIAALVLFLVLFAIGIWGLAVSVGSGLSILVRQNIYNTAKYYSSGNPNSYASMAINWLQSTFHCCGIDSTQDWRIFYSLMFQQQATNGGYFPNQYNLNYNQQLTSTVPDTCCVNSYPNCGQLTNIYQQAQPQYGGLIYGSGGYGSNQYLGQYSSSYGNIYTQGCLKPYITRYQTDLVFVAAYCFGVSTVGALVCIVYVALFFYFKSKSS